jgi:hypothetical protein
VFVKIKSVEDKFVSFVPSVIFIELGVVVFVCVSFAIDVVLLSNIILAAFKVTSSSVVIVISVSSENLFLNSSSI